MQFSTFIRKANLLKRRFEKLKSSVLQTENFAKSSPLSDAQLKRLTCWKNELSESFREFNELLNRLIEQEPIPEEYDDELVAKYQGEMLDLYADLTGVVLSLIKETNVKSESSAEVVSNENSQSRSSVRLPKIDLPHFNGESTKWMSFSNLFDTTINKNPSLSPVEKFQYLLSSLHGEALNAVSGLPLSDDNYSIAWKLLHKRYHNVRKLVSLHLNKIIDMPPLIYGSQQSFRTFVSTYYENTQALIALQHDVTKENILLATLLLRKLDFETRKRFEDTRGINHEFPIVTDLIKFLEAESIHFEDASVDSRTKISPKCHGFRATKTALVAINSKGCAYCQDMNHSIYHCPSFREKSSHERQSIVRQKHWCYNCLGTSHSVKSCKSARKCQTCNEKHHSLLHINNSNLNKTSHNQSSPVVSLEHASSPKELTTNPSFVGFSSTKHSTSVLLATTLVRLTTSAGCSHIVRGVLDSAAQCSFISEHCAQLLKVKRQRSANPISGVSQAQVKTHGLTCLSVSSISGMVLAHSHPMIILEKITSDLPRAVVSPEVKVMMKSFVLADPTFDQPSPIDVLIGADLFPHVFTGFRCPLGENLPVAFDTIFGFVLMGSAPTTSTAEKNHLPSVSLISINEFDLHASIQQFWQLEEPPLLKISPEDHLCEEHFKATHFRDEDGRYVTRLPFKEPHPPLGNSAINAKRRFLGLERRLSSQPELKDKYVKFMQDYLISGHMLICEKVPEFPNYFLPHHGVFKTHDPASKIRVVFDASARTSSDVSLNDILYSGPKLQNDICEIILCFRCHSFVFSCDIRQMYRQIKIHPDDQRYQLIYWRAEPTDPLLIYKLTTVTYGVTSAPFLAIRTLHQLAEDEGEKYPRAANVLKSQTFVDNIVTGADNIHDAVSLQNELKELLLKGGFELRKWCSNSPDLISIIPEEEREMPLFFQNTGEPLYGLLGLKWNSISDHFFYSVKVSEIFLTKRSVLSVIAKIYDPCGWLTPVVFWAKSFIQLLWILDLHWDDPLPSDAALKWKTFLKSLPFLEEIRLPRCVSLSEASTVQLHGFSDASELGYAAVIYLRCVTPKNEIKISLFMAKSRVAPLKRISLPRLELCGAYLLAKLLHYSKVLISNYHHIDSVSAWCDSTVVLSWIHTPPFRLKVYAANRVAQIQEWISPQHWFYVSTAHNPADCASRGLKASHLKTHHLWWYGPPWLSFHSGDHPLLPFVPLKEENLPEMKSLQINANLATESSEWDLLTKFSSWSKLQRVVAYIKRFLQNSRSITKQSGFLSCQELLQATSAICKIVQQTSFKDEISSLTKRKPCSTRIQRLMPFLDQDGLLRVGGRLKNTSLPYHSKHPILLPKSHHVVNLLIDYYHLKYMHAGPQLLQSMLCTHYWVISARSVIRTRIFKCMRCFRCKPRNVPPLMGDLPQPRVTSARVFKKTGVDYAGPFQVKLHSLKRMVPLKAYLCLFICLCIKAVHLEVVTDLTSEAFIAALTRFISRRGICTDIYSDCGTNFIGASTQLTRTIKRFYSSPQVKEGIHYFSTQNMINFHFIPPAAPHQGGLWESAIKSAKHHLTRTIGQTILSLEEFNTLVIKVEAMLNSRPLTPLSADPSDMSVLTPGHFLIGDPLTALPEEDLAASPTNRLSRWQMVQAFSQRIWTRWHREYLHTLQQRSKWTISKENLKVGDLVVVHEANTPPLLWCTARITSTSPGKDGVVRVVQLRTSKGTLSRPVTKVFPLPLDA